MFATRNNVSESSVRFQVRLRYREEGVLDTYKQYPIDSLERSYALSEAQQIAFQEHKSSSADTGEPQ